MTEKCDLADLLGLSPLLNLHHPLPLCLLEMSDCHYFVRCRRLAATRNDY